MVSYWITTQTWVKFLLRDAYAQHSMLWQDVRPSVRLCLKDYTYPQSFLPSGSDIILVFPYQTGWQYSDGNLWTGASNARGVWKNHDFRPLFRFISEMMQDRAIVNLLRKVYRKLAPKLSTGTSLNDLDWPLTQILRSRYYSASNNSKTVRDKAILTMADQ